VADRKATCLPHHKSIHINMMSRKMISFISIEPFSTAFINQNDCAFQVSCNFTFLLDKKDKTDPLIRKMLHSQDMLCNKFRYFLIYQ